LYNILIWKDHAINPNNTYTVKENPDGSITLTPKGEVLQQGTNMSATNFNNMEFGIADSDLAQRLLLMRVNENSKAFEELLVEEQTVTLTNTASYPFNNSSNSISFITVRKNTNYTVDFEIIDTDGNVGEFVVDDKQLNGFKLRFTGSATTVTVKLKIRGGII